MPHDAGRDGEQPPSSPADAQVAVNLVLKALPLTARSHRCQAGGPGELRRPAGSADPAVGEMRTRLAFAHAGGIADR